MEPPNHEMSPMRVLLKIQKSEPPKLDQPSKWSKDFNEFIAACLIKDPVQRPLAESLLKVIHWSNLLDFFKSNLFILQLPFIDCKLDAKPIRDLLLEYKAEVVEEELEDEEEVIFLVLDYNRALLISRVNLASLFNTESTTCKN
jgi:STE20-like kinase